MCRLTFAFYKDDFKFKIVHINYIKFHILIENKTIILQVKTNQTKFKLYITLYIVSVISK